MERLVKGIWVPIEIWEAKELSWNEKILLMEIDSYTSKGKPCFISNEYVGSMFGVSEQTASKYMNKLISLGFVVVEKFDGRARYVSSTLQGRLKENFKADLKKTLRQTSRKLDDTYNTNLPDIELPINSSSNEEDNKRKTPFPFKKKLVDLGVSEEVAAAWIQVRKAKRAVNSEIAFNKVKREIEKSGRSANECITIAVERSWQGFSASWLEDRRSFAAARQPRESVYSHNLRVMDEMYGTNMHEQEYGINSNYDEQ